jgi:hypothetical protein
MIVFLPHPAGAQTAAADAYTPITNAERGQWIVNSIAGPRSLSIGVFTSSWLTAVDEPREWHRSWSGFGKRYVNREANIAISNSIEAGLGAAWGEDPRYVRLGRGRIWPRALQAIKLSVLAPRRDGRLRPAWGRHTGTVVSNVVANSWLPPSATSAKGTTWRISSGVLGRLAGNAFEEFWPDVRKRFTK